MKYVIDTAPNAERAHLVFQRLRTHDVRHHTGPASAHLPKQYFLLNEQHDVLGGLLGYHYWDALHIQTLWISESIRGCGHGKALLQQAEATARADQCERSLVQTTDFNAPQFYRSQGYHVAGKIEGWPNNGNFYYLTKLL